MHQALIVVALACAVVSGVVGQQQSGRDARSVGRFLQEQNDTTRPTLSPNTCFEYRDTTKCTDSFIDHCRIVPNITADFSQANILIEKIFSTISFVGGVFTLVTYCVSPVVRNPQILVEVQLAFTCLISNVKSFFGGLPMYDLVTCCPTVSCTVEAAVENYAPLAAIMWSGCIAVQAYLLIVIGMTPKQIDQVYKYFYVVGYGVPFVFTLIPLVASWMGPAGLFCWIPSSLIWQQVVFYYMWLFVVDLLILGLVIHIGFAVRGTKGQGLVYRFVAYASWAVFCTFGFVVLRVGEWASDLCSSWPPVELQVWNSIWFPAQGLGYAVIFAMNRNVHQGWADFFSKCKSVAELRHTQTGALADEDKNATYSNVEMSALSDADIVTKVSEEGYSDDDDSD